MELFELVENLILFPPNITNNCIQKIVWKNCILDHHQKKWHEMNIFLFQIAIFIFLFVSVLKSKQTYFCFQISPQSFLSLVKEEKRRKLKEKNVGKMVKKNQLLLTYTLSAFFIFPHFQWKRGESEKNKTKFWKPKIKTLILFCFQNPKKTLSFGRLKKQTNKQKYPCFMLFYFFPLKML